MCDFDLLFRKSKHEIVNVLYHESTQSKSWFNSGIYTASTRNGIATKLKSLPHTNWSTYSQLLNKINKIDFDYLCLGNGNDDVGIALQRDLNCKFLFSEYGWLPWGQCFYVDNKGVGKNSSIFHHDLNVPDAKPEELSAIKRSFNNGNPIPFKKFIYVPLQVDTPTSDGKKDFKFKYTQFENNASFLQFVATVVPKEWTILVKKHPASKGNLKLPSGMIDISDSKLNKHELYSRMDAMMCINSTSAIEALLFNKPVFTYGQDIFCNKGLTHEQVGADQFVSLLAMEPKNASKFISLLLQRQVYRHLCQNQDYINSHYWINKCG